MAQISIYIGRRKVVEFTHEADWIDGQTLYDTAPRKGTIYAIIGNRVRDDLPVTAVDKFATNRDRDFYLEV